MERVISKSIVLSALAAGLAIVIPAKSKAQSAPQTQPPPSAPNKTPPDQNGKAAIGSLSQDGKPAIGSLNQDGRTSSAVDPHPICSNCKPPADPCIANPALCKPSKKPKGDKDPPQKSKAPAASSAQSVSTPK